MKVVEVVKETKEYKIVKKRSGRYGVLKPNSRTWINGEEKQAILLKAGLITVTEPKKEEAPAEEPATSEEAATEEAPAEEEKAE